MIVTIDTDNLDSFEWKSEDAPMLLEAFDKLRFRVMFTEIGNYYSPEEAPKDSPSWVKEELNNVGKQCHIDGHNDTTYIFKGIQETLEDFYYILEDINHKIIYSSCIGKIEYV